MPRRALRFQSTTKKYSDNPKGGQQNPLHLVIAKKAVSQELSAPTSSNAEARAEEKAKADEAAAAGELAEARAGEQANADEAADAEELAEA